jgi:diguanylate cyclase (GGDEF)-like protein
MSEAQAQRDRRLIQNTAALLSEDYPLDQLAARLCDALALELGAQLAFVALCTAPGDPLVVAAAAGEQADERPTGSTLSEGTPALAALRKGTPIALRSRAEFAAYANPAWSDAAAGMFVPIVHGEQPLGVLAVVSEREGAFDEQDLRLLQAVARYFGIAVRNRRNVDVLVRGKRRPTELYAIVAIAVVALLLSIAIWTNVALRAHEMIATARSAAFSHLQNTAAGLSDHIEDSSQLATSAAALFDGLPHDRALIENTLTSLLRSAQSSSVFGIGVWYEPGRFAPGVALYGPYAVRQGNAPVSITHQWMTAAYNYPAHPWYRLGIDAGGSVVYTEPYFDTDYVYVSAVRAFHDGSGRIAGVVTVDSILQQYQSVISRNGQPRWLTYITSQANHVILTSQDDAVLAFARAHGVVARNVGKVPRPIFEAFLASRIGSDTVTFASTLPYTDWTLRLAVDRATLTSDANRFTWLGIAAIALLWIFALSAIAYVRKSSRQVEHTVDLERQQVELTREIAERQRAEELLRERAYRDELTRLPNRAFVIAELQRMLERIRLDGAGQFCVLYIDLDRFNVINDSLGHDSGDLVLVEIGQRLSRAAGAGRLVGRLGGDEFVIVLPDARRPEAVKFAERILGMLRRAFTVNGRELFIGASIGIAPIDAQYSLPEEVLRDADAAMYEAKRSGRSVFRIFDRSMHTRAVEALSMETDLRWALVRNEIYAAYQPIVSIADERIVGFEALARWEHPSRGAVPAEKFITLAEQTGLIVDIDLRMLANVCAATKSWVQEFPDLYLSVNASAAHLARTDDLSRLEQIVSASGFPLAALRIELTETAVMESRGKAEEVFAQLRTLGIGVLVDDFGTGYSSLGYLQRLPIEGLKIDRSFISEMATNEKARAIVLAILAIAEALGMRVIAEGVESREELDRLRAIGIPFAQGYYFSHAVSADEALAMLRASSAKSRPAVS